MFYFLYCSACEILKLKAQKELVLLFFWIFSSCNMFRFLEAKIVRCALVKTDSKIIKFEMEL